MRDESYIYTNNKAKINRNNTIATRKARTARNSHNKDSSKLLTCLDIYTRKRIVVYHMQNIDDSYKF